ncbi:hypothetical protein [Stieleria varia]|uniref:hypothetical protein n=1 Tax=Stieleria varia TaxID=2528005 RepID=UPI0011B47DCD|nr:hypothetical protein [Stieleria varia]
MNLLQKIAVSIFLGRISLKFAGAIAGTRLDRQLLGRVLPTYVCRRSHFPVKSRHRQGFLSEMFAASPKYSTLSYACISQLGDRWAALLLCCLASLACSGLVWGQAGGSMSVPQTNLAPLAVPPSYGSPGYGSPGFAPSYGQSFAPGTGPSLQSQVPTYGGGATYGGGIDPYSIQTPGGYGTQSVYPGGYASPVPSMGGLFSGGVQPAPPAFGTTTYGAPVGGYDPSGFGAGAYPLGSPSTLFPGGILGPTPGYGGEGFSMYRFLQGPRARHTFIGSSNDDNSLMSNDTDVSIAFALPPILASTQPIYVVPSFSFHSWDGPIASTGADLPSKAFSAFLDTGWQSDPNRIFGAEFGVRVGAFSEFDSPSSDVFRIMGKGLGSVRITPASTLKLGVHYLDRNHIKILPAGGLLWQPNPFTRFDIFFPQPKFARYWRTLGTNDVWWYLNADYGGGTWAITRDDGRSDEVDINDIRVAFGWEWGQSQMIRQGRRVGFMEIGYVFDRELYYRQNKVDNLSLDDGIMVRLGFGY